MDRQLDMMVDELEKLKATLAELSHDLAEQAEEYTMMVKALRHCCERIAVASRLDFFELTRDEQNDVVESLMVDYLKLARKGDYDPRHAN